MPRRFTAALAAAVVAILGFGAAGASAETFGNVTTAGYGTLRDNWDANEPALAPASVQSASFGKLFSAKLVGAVYAQPLVYNGTVVVTTEAGKAYGVNASTGAIVWKRAFGIPLKATTIRCGDLRPLLGSTSTPVIDPATGTVYITTHLEEGGTDLAHAKWALRAISATTGAEEPGFPVPITGTPENTPGIPFNEALENQRPGLLLMNGVVYIGFGSYCDITPYRGVVVGVSTVTHQITTMWTDEAGVGAGEGSQAGIWQSGGGLVSDIPGRVILATGNGVSPQPAPGNQPPETLSESVVSLAVNGEGKLLPTQFFAPSNATALDGNDEDLGSGGPAALPTEYFGTAAIPHLLVESGKDGRIFLINADNMGGYRQGPGETDAVLQTLGPFTGVWGHPAVYGGQGGWVYVLDNEGGGNLIALSYGLSGGGTPALSVGGTSPQTFAYTSGSPLVTSNGTTAGSAVVWALYLSANTNGSGAELRAYNAIPSSGSLELLWSTPIGYGSKFSVPTAAGGRIFVGTRNGRLLAFGNSTAAAVQAAPLNIGSVAVGASRTATLSVAVTRPLTLTSPLLASGLRTATPAESAAAAKPLKIAGATAGPKKIRPSGSLALEPGVVTVQQPPLGRAIAAGTTLHLRVRFAPTHPGAVLGTITIRTTAGTEPVTFTGYASRRGLIATGQQLSFGTVSSFIGGKSLSTSISNSWTRPERITAIDVPAAPFRVVGLPATGTVLAPRQGFTVGVTVDPGRSGSFRSVLRVHSDAGWIALPLKVTAVAGAPRLIVSTRHIDFGAVRVGDSSTAALQVGDAGPVAVTVTRAIAPTGDFSLVEPLPEGIVIGRDVHATVRVRFAPTARGPASATYVVAGNDGRGYTRVALTGRGV